MAVDSIDLREIVNGVWFCLNAALAFVFWRHVAQKVRSPGSYAEAATQAAIALGFYFTGSTIMRAWVWSLLLIQRRGDDAAFLEDQIAIPLTAASLAVLGALCCIRVFSPGRWGRFFWIGTGIVAVGLPTAVHLLV